MSEVIIVVGSGVIGLTCAWILSENGYNVKIIADNFPSTFKDETNYTSPWAGAHFRPCPATSEGDLKDFPLTRDSFKIFKDISETFPESSVRFMKGIDYIEANEKPYVGLSKGYSEGLENFEIINKRDLPENVKFGATYDAWCLNSPLYLQFLERRLKMFYNVAFKHTNLVSLKQISQIYQGCTIINCSGMGLSYNGGYDPNCYPVRGQTLLVRAPKNCVYRNMTVTYRLSDDKYSFVIPRPLDGGIIVGGTRQPENLDATPSMSDTEELISNAMKRFPELITYQNGNPILDIKKINVGFRPMRKGGVRLERECFDNVQIIHCYGFGSSGFEMSWGAAQLVLQLLQKLPSKL